MVEGILSILAAFFPAGLIESMQESKTLTIMVFVGTIAFALFVFFLFKMAGS